MKEAQKFAKYSELNWNFYKIMDKNVYFNILYVSLYMHKCHTNVQKRNDYSYTVHTI